MFDAVVNPKKLSGYFTTWRRQRAAGRRHHRHLVGTVPVEVDEVEQDKRIVLRWDAEVAEGQPRLQDRIEMGFEVLEDGATFVTIGEAGWGEDAVGRKASYGNCEGWAEMLSAMKALLEYGINLREGFYPSEMRGELPTTSERK